MSEANKDLIPNLFRTEYSKLVAVLCSTFGLSQIEIAEDIVSDTFLLAADTWGKKGIPDRQEAWLYQVAKNRTRDYLRREKIRLNKVEPYLKQESHNQRQEILDLSPENIKDSQLRMLFAICHPSLDEKSQIILALRILCGFGIDEIASALLSNKETINKRLYRSKIQLRKQSIELELDNSTTLSHRLDTVLTTLYLLFSEGYYSSSNEIIIRKDLCLEAMRLTLLLLNTPATSFPHVHAFLSLMCFHASRFEARIDQGGALILYEDQDRSLWDTELIERGEYYLNQSSTGNKLSKYHLEAAIAYWHTQDEEEKWENILQLYNYLLQIEYSPIAALNRTYALAKANGKAEGLKEALKLQLTHPHYHILLADLYEDSEMIRHHLIQALQLAKTEHERSFVQQKLQAVQE